MTENSPAGLTLLAPDREVVVAGDECDQPALQTYAPLADGLPRKVVVELGFAPIAGAPHQGRRGVEVRLDGQRVGELSTLMSARYGPLLDDVLFHGGSPACVAQVVNGGRGIEVELRLPSVGAALPPGSSLPALTGAAPAPARRRTPYLVGAGVAALLIVVGTTVGRGGDGGDGGDGTVPTADGAAVVVATTTAAPAPTSTAAVPTVRRTAPASQHAPRPVPETAPPAAPEPSDPCDADDGDCAPVAGDVECADEGDDGPAYVSGSVEITGTDVDDPGSDDDGAGCG